jgi:hypothetical protein
MSATKAKATARAKEKEKVRCVFCNSLSHHMDNCNSTFNGKRKSLDSGWSCLMDDDCPSFNILAANELRYVAYHYAAYEGAIHDWREKNTQHYNRKFRFRPIDLSLSKAQLIKELARRWEGFQPVRGRYQTKPVPTEDDDCPICLECTTTSYKWAHTVSSWVKVEDKVTTECKHSFCKKCWASHTEKNRRYDYSATGNHHSAPNLCVKCPMCRHKIAVQ